MTVLSAWAAGAPALEIEVTAERLRELTSIFYESGMRGALEAFQLGYMHFVHADHLDRARALKDLLLATPRRPGDPDAGSAL